MLAQRLQRVFRVRRLHRGLWRTRNERHGKAFDRKWGRVVEGMGRVRVGRKGGGGSSGTGLGGFRWEDEKAKYDMVLDRGSIEGEGGGVGGEEDGAAERADIRALQKIMGDVALTPAPLSAAWEEDSEEEEEQEYGQGVVQGQGMGQGQGQEQWGPVIYEIEVTGDVVRWRKEADAALFNMFYRRVQMLASGHRSYAYSKRLVDTTLPRGVHLRETKLNKGMRILWTQLRRGVEKPAILVSGDC
ncbi:hypothetical protein B484DRAFT_151742 [Ochromonadaceae sp. CCMP2298]|nr:hypothetical protein B484DRAFT_151742 [Ochromonadaceae sp. CCMP2298]